jgi:hypothetical protein
MSLWWVIYPLIIPLTLVKLDPHRGRCSFFAIEYILLASSLIYQFVGVVVFYMIVPSNWSKLDLSYKIGWCVIMTPASLLVGVGVLALLL